MADPPPDEDSVLAALERQLREDDPSLGDRFARHGGPASWPLRSWTVSWLVWTATWFVVHLAVHNPAALVLATTSAIIYPLALGAALRIRG